MKENLGIFESVWVFIWNMIKNSIAYKFIKGIYESISKSWRNSKIAGWFRKLHFSENALAGSIAGRVIRSPFTFLEFIGRKYGDRLNNAISGSLIFELCRTYLDNILALNLRFIGVLASSSSLSAFLVRLVTDGSVELGLLAAAVIGIVLTLSNTNITECFKHSALCSLVLRLLDIEADFNWFQKESATKRGRLILAVALGIVVGLAGGLVGTILIPVALIGLAGFMLIVSKPSFSVFVLLFMAPIAPTMVGVGLSLLSIFSMVVYSLLHKGFKWKFDGIGFFMILFIAIYLVAGINSFAMVKSLSIWAIYLAFMAVYFVIINSINTKKLLNNLLICFVMSGLLVCLYGIAQYLFGWDTAQAWMDEEMFGEIKMRIYSTLGNPNVLGEYILLVLPVAIGIMWTRKRAEAKIVYAGISALMFGALILTFSRGCWIGLMFAAAIFVTFAAGKLWGLALAALPVIPMVLPESIINRFLSIGDMKDSSTSYRVYIWMGTLAMMKDFWLSGIGMGQEAFNQVYPYYSYNGVVAPHSHNLFLQILVEAGVVGIAVFLLIMFFYIRRIMTGYQFGGKGAVLSTQMTAITAGIMGFLLQGMFDNCFYNYRVMLVFWCVLALGRVCVYIAEQGGERIND